MDIQYKTPLKKRLQQREYQHKNLKQRSLYAREYQRKHPEKTKVKHLKQRYGIDFSELKYNEMCILQQNKCAICEKEVDKLSIDHDHIRGNVRALLCSNCNHGLGNFKDDPLIMIKAVEYINKWKNLNK
jgi:hypothetical protein